MTALKVKQDLIRECTESIEYYEKEIEKAKDKKQHILVIEAYKKVIHDERQKRNLIEKHFKI